MSKPSETTGVFTAKDPFERPGKPGQPEISDIEPESCNLAWSKPEKDGRSPITNYIIEMKEVGDIKVSNQCMEILVSLELCINCVWTTIIFILCFF